MLQCMRTACQTGEEGTTGGNRRGAEDRQGREQAKNVDRVRGVERRVQEQRMLVHREIEVAFSRGSQRPDEWHSAE